jgi:hypothetical protein
MSTALTGISVHDMSVDVSGDAPTSPLLQFLIVFAIVGALFGAMCALGAYWLGRAGVGCPSRANSTTWWRTT